LAIFVGTCAAVEPTTYTMYTNLWCALLSHQSFKNANPNPIPNPNTNPKP